jgi:hypothetical protein
MNNIERFYLKLRSRTFKKYVAVGLIVFVLANTLSTFLTYVGVEVLGLKVFHVSPIIYTIVFSFGFLTKFILYEKWGMLKNG